MVLLSAVFFEFMGVFKVYYCSIISVWLIHMFSRVPLE